MNLRFFLRVGIWIVLACVVVGVGGGLLTYVLTPSVYQSTSQILLTPATTKEGSSVVASDYVASRSTAYAAIAAGPGFQDLVRASLGIDQQAKYPTISVSTTSGTSLISIQTTSTRSVDARAAARMVDELLIQRVSDFDGRDGTAVIYANIVTSPALSDVSMSPSRVSTMAIGGTIGLLVGLAAVYAFSRPRVGSRQPGQH